MNQLKTTIGILGGGQLGRMLIEEGLRLNLNFNILDPDENCSCAKLANTFVHAPLTNQEGIVQLAKVSDILTYEIEHVNTEALLKLEQEGKTIIPSPAILQLIQDKGLQKEFYLKHNIPTLPFVLVNQPSDWPDAIAALGTEKFVAKTRKGGYDGKGVSILTSSEIISNPANIPFNEPCMLEAFLPCEKELAVIVARDQFGNIAAYPSIEMEFDPEANLVTLLISPARVGSVIEQKAEQIAKDLVMAFNGPGLFAVEMFLSSNGEIYVNEVAPRPHNSGHHTIEANITSQYEQLLRILCGLPLGSTQLVTPVAGMLNLLGAKHFSGTYQLKGTDDVMKLPGTYIHLYDKTTSKPMRKMGHVTFLANSYEELTKNAAYTNGKLHFEVY